jgi:hypothetical protein
MALWEHGSAMPAATPGTALRASITNLDQALVRFSHPLATGTYRFRLQVLDTARNQNQPVEATVEVAAPDLSPNPSSPPSLHRPCHRDKFSRRRKRVLPPAASHPGESGFSRRQRAPPPEGDSSGDGEFTRWRQGLPGPQETIS